LSPLRSNGRGYPNPLGRAKQKGDTLGICYILRDGRNAVQDAEETDDLHEATPNVSAFQSQDKVGQAYRDQKILTIFVFLKPKCPFCSLTCIEGGSSAPPQ
jgi:hypothetical protein